MSVLVSKNTTNIRNYLDNMLFIAHNLHEWERCLGWEFYQIYLLRGSIRKKYATFGGNKIITYFCAKHKYKSYANCIYPLGICFQILFQ